MRLFVAIDLPDEVKAALARAQARLRDDAPRADVRWTPPRGLHLTLRFLGEVGEAAVPGVIATLTAAASGHPAVELAATGVGVFPQPTRPRVLWAGIEGALAGLAADIEGGLVALGHPQERRPFSAHVTLGRVRRPVALAALNRAIAGLGRPEFGAWTAREVVLYRSHQRPTGSVYEALAQVPLSAPCP